MKFSNKIVLAVAAGVAALFLAKKKGVAGISGVDWEHAIWRAENELGVDFSKSFFEQSRWLMEDLAGMGRQMGYRAPRDNGRSYGRNFYYALKRKAHIPE